MLGGLFDYLDSVKARDPAPRYALGSDALSGCLGARRFTAWPIGCIAASSISSPALINHFGRFLTADRHSPRRDDRTQFLHRSRLRRHRRDRRRSATTSRSTSASRSAAPIRPTALAASVIRRSATASIIGSGAQVLGPITVGERARIGANAVVTRDVPEGATMTGIPARAALVDAAQYQRDFVPYGTPCSEIYDPQTQKVELMRCELERLRAQLDALHRRARYRQGARPRLMELVPPSSGTAPGRLRTGRADPDPGSLRSDGLCRPLARLCDRHGPRSGGLLRLSPHRRESGISHREASRPPQSPRHVGAGRGGRLGPAPWP